MGSGSAADPAARRGCRPRDVDAREVLNARVLPAVDRLPVGCLAQAPAAQEHGVQLFLAVALESNAATAHQPLYVQIREAAGRAAEPKVAILDSQSAKAE
jgi:hypothetical protein